MIIDENGRAVRDCYLSLGANLGDRARSLRLALEALSRMEGTELCSVSSFYETEPWGVTGQPDFLNGAAKIRTVLEPLELLRRTQEIEYRLGRVRHEHWGARTMDIDLLCMPGITVDTEQLKLPHPLLQQRAFVLQPLAEIAGTLEICGRRVRELLSACEDPCRVRDAEGSPAELGLRLIACVDAEGGLGRQGKLLFSIREDLQRFRAFTLGHTIILGRKTWESLPGGRPLENRRHIVLSRQEPPELPPNVDFVQDLDGLWHLLKREQPEECWVIGGAEVYRELLPYCNRAEITVVPEHCEADCFLPDLDRRPEFCRISREYGEEAGTGRKLEYRSYRRQEQDGNLSE